MSGSDDGVSLNPFVTGDDPDTLEEFCSPFGQAAQEEEPYQHQEVEVRGTQQATQKAARTLFEQELRSEEQQEQDIEEQSDSASCTEQEKSIMPNNTTATPMKGLPTVHATASDMSEIQDPLDVSQLKGGTCENPRSDRGADPKAIGKIKARATYALDLKFGLPYYYGSGKCG